MVSLYIITRYLLFFIYYLYVYLVKFSGEVVLRDTAPKVNPPRLEKFEVEYGWPMRWLSGAQLRRPR